MDEPTAALTESDVTRLFDVVRRLKQRGVGIVYISHRLDEIFAIADRVTVLRDGAYVGSRDVADTNVGELVQMMVGRRLESLFPKTVAPIGAPVLEARDLVRRPLTKGVSLTVRVGRDRRHRGARGFGPQRTRADAVRHDAERVRRDSAQRRKRANRLARDRARERRRLRAGRSRHAGPGQGDERPAQFFARGAWVSVARRIYRPRCRAADGAGGRRAISASRQVRSTRSQAGCPAAISRRSCSANGSPTIPSS